MLLLSGGLVFAVFSQVRTGLRPLFELRDRVVDIREGRADHVGGTYPREIAPLANELNSLIGHNKDVVERAQTHVSNLAHGLKTPLAVLLNEAGGSKSKLAEIVNRQANAMKNQVDHHLQRARAATRGQSIGMATSVAESVDPLARTLGRIYRDKDIDFDILVAEGLIFRGEKRDFEEIIGNLMDNACKWTKSKVRVIAQGDGKDNGLFMLEVSDDGEGLTREQYPEALKRGARLDETTPGTGFGLPIVDDLARAYKGSLVLGKSDLGGLKVTVTLPGRIDE
jgi:signal transduction histidine kinase